MGSRACEISFCRLARKIPWWAFRVSIIDEVWRTCVSLLRCYRWLACMPVCKTMSGFISGI